MSIGERIKSARIMANQSQRDLAEAANVSAMAISKYEREMDIPGSAILIRLAKALNVKIEYFFRPTSVSLAAPTYRKRASLPDVQEASILEHVQEWLERYLDIESLLNVNPNVDIPVKQYVATLDEIERVAIDLRKQWQIGLGPINNLMELCEDHGIKLELVNGHEAFDGLTLWANDTIPVIILQHNISGDRQRFCLAHELGHLVLDLAKNMDKEKAAHRFAGAFLVPQPVVEQELGLKRHTIGFRELQLLKKKYGLSMQAWIYRIKDLHILSEPNAIQLFKLFRQRGWYKEEPGEAVPSEEPQRFTRLVMHALYEDIISEARAAELLHVSVSRFLAEGMKWDDGPSIDMCS